MNLALSLKTLALLAFVAAATIIIIPPTPAASAPAGLTSHLATQGMPLLASTN